MAKTTTHTMGEGMDLMRVLPKKYRTHMREATAATLEEVVIEARRNARGLGPLGPRLADTIKVVDDGDELTIRVGSERPSRGGMKPSFARWKRSPYGSKGSATHNLGAAYMFGGNASDGRTPGPSGGSHFLYNDYIDTIEGRNNRAGLMGALNDAMRDAELEI